MDIQFGNLTNVNFLWVVLLVVVVCGFAAFARRSALKRFATSDVVHSMIPTGSKFAWLTNLLSIVALLALVPALCDVRWGKTWREVPQKGVEVVFALDVSRSMLAEDVAPNRLQRAKQQIKDMVDEMAGDRVGLVAFAGKAVRKIPLTSHYNDFKRALDEVGLHDVTHGGSNLGDAVRMAISSFLSKTTDHKAIVLFTDGEDHESDPVGAAQEAHEKHGIQVFTVGLGDDREGARVPTRTANREGRYLVHDGQQVWSKLDGKVLKEIALVSDGAFIPAGTKQVNMSQVYRNYVAQVEEQDMATARINGYVPRFQWFVGAGLLLLLAESIVASRASQTVGKKSKSTSSSRSMSRYQAVPLSKAAAILVALSAPLTNVDAEAAEPEAYELARQASKAMDVGDFEKAVNQYSQASTLAPDKYEWRFNQAVALYRSGDINAARQLFAAATVTANRKLEAKARFNLANCDYSDALRLSGEDLEAAKAKAESAISHYRGAIAADPADGDARANIELASLLLRRLNQELSAQEPSPQPQDPAKSKDESMRKDSQQESEGGASGDGTKQSIEPQSNGADSAKNKDGRQSQSGDSDPKETQSNESKSNQTQSEELHSESKEDGITDKATESISEPEHDEESKQPQSSNERAEVESGKHPSQTAPAESPKNNLERRQENLPQEKDAIDASPPEQKTSIPPDGELRAANVDPDNASTAKSSAKLDVGTPMTQQEAMKMLQAVRDRDLMRRLQNARKSERRYIPGDKDW